ncbi:MAG: glycosyltransferase [Gluconacetobacter diazotrophicus]|nr:glycosyltransferase [Gluconacetobacter diazotrophicus]
MSDRLRVLSIAHAGVSHAAGRLRYLPFAHDRDVDLRLVVPARWHQFGRTLVADPPDGSGLDLRIEPILLPKAGPMSWYLHFYPRLRRLIREFDPDVIHLWEEPWSIVALQACLLKGRAALMLEVDQNILKTLPPPFETIRRFVLGRTAHILSRSPDATAVVRARGYAGPVSAIGYGVDEVRFHPPTHPAPPRTDGGLTVGYVGRLVVEKGLDDALDALARTTAPVSLAIMGEGPHEAQLRARIAALGLGDRVTILGWGPPDEVAPFMWGLDALILVTRTTKAVREQFGRVIIEAQSCGVPVIGSTCGAIPSVVGPGGWIVPESDPEALARLFDHIATAPDERRARAAAGRAHVAQNFTTRAVADSLLRAWASGATSGSRQPALVPEPAGSR